jgi:CubicO group peptidase (beta-lactamase class C family)
MKAICLILSTAFVAACGSEGDPPLLNDDTRLELDAVLQSAVGEGALPGVVALVVDRDRVLYRGAAGVMDTDGSEPMAPEAIFQIFSMTKPITSLGVMILQEEGLLSIDDTASDYLPELADREVLLGISADSSVRARPASRPVTIKDLLRHTSGFGYTFSSPELLEVSRSTPIPARSYPLLHDPGDRWTYGMSTAFLGWIIEEVTGQSLPDFLSSRITGPLGMEDTSFDLAPQDHGRLVATYRRVDGALEGQPRPDQYQPLVRGDGGLLSTASDYGRFAQLILGGGKLGGVRVVSEASVAEMVRDQLEGIKVLEQPSAQPNISMAFPLGAGKDGFGLGFQISVGESVGGRPAGTLSWAGILNTHFWIDPTNGLAVVLLLQLLPFYDEEVIDLMTTFEQTLYDGLSGGGR